MKRIHLIFPLMILFSIHQGCTANPETTMTNKTDSATIRYVALGDSYTICEGASEKESWPLNLAADLTAKKIPVSLIANPSRTGWTTQDLIDRELPVFDKSGA